MLHLMHILYCSSFTIFITLIKINIYDSITIYYKFFFVLINFSKFIRSFYDIALICY